MNNKKSWKDLDFREKSETFTIIVLAFAVIVLSLCSLAVVLHRILTE